MVLFYSFFLGLLQSTGTIILRDRKMIGEN